MPVFFLFDLGSQFLVLVMDLFTEENQREILTRFLVRRNFKSRIFIGYGLGIKNLLLAIGVLSYGTKQSNKYLI